MAKARGQSSGGRRAVRPLRTSAAHSSQPTQSETAHHPIGETSRPLDPIVVYIHGIGPQEPPVKLKRQYDLALFGRDLGERSRLGYWADLLHPVSEANPLAAQAMPVRGTMVAEPALEIAVDVWTRGNAAAQASIQRLAEEIQRDQVVTDEHIQRTIGQLAQRRGESHTQAFHTRIIPIEPVRKWMTEAITRRFLTDVAAYFYNADLRQRIQRRLQDIVIPGDRRYILVAHSLGTVIAYDVLR